MMESSQYPKPHACQCCQTLLLHLPQTVEKGNTIVMQKHHDGQLRIGPCTAPDLSENDSVEFLQLEIATILLSEYTSDGCSFFWALSNKAPRRPPYWMESSEELVMIIRLSPTYIQFGKLQRSRGIPEFEAYDGLSFAIVTEQGSSAMTWIGQSSNNIHPSSQASLLEARRWLRTCLEIHDQCRAAASDFMPTRLLKIEDHGDKHITLRLEDTAPNVHHNYAALSYCWGGEQLLRTTKDSLVQHKCAVSYNDLPPTLRDAVITTYGLDLQYLWVDALCIVQDDDVDRSSEIDMMSFVYSSAAVSIMASRAESVRDGFLQDRQTFYDSHNKTDQKAFKLKFQGPDEIIGDIVLVTTNQGTKYPEQTPNEPLWTRGWAFQERIASHRILEYGTSRSHWLCRTLCATDRYEYPYDDHKLRHLWLQRFRDTGLPEMLDLNIQTETSEGYRGFVGLPLSYIKDQNLRMALMRWNNIIQEFTHKQLTFQTDRLAAIAGIAQRYQSSFQGKYVAGIWESALQYSLLWVRDPYPSSIAHERPNTYIAPSWSWACLTQPISTFNFDYDENSPVIEVKEANVGHENGLGKYGAVTSGHLKLRGYVTSAIYTIDIDYGPAELRSRDLKRYESMVLYHDANETDLLKSKGRNIDVDLLVVHVVGPTERVTGLILHKSEDGIHSRLGVFQCPRNGYEVERFPNAAQKFIEVPKKTVVIK